MRHDVAQHTTYLQCVLQSLHVLPTRSLLACSFGSLRTLFFVSFTLFPRCHASFSHDAARQRITDYATKHNNSSPHMHVVANFVVVALLTLCARARAHTHNHINIWSPTNRFVRKYFASFQVEGPGVRVRGGGGQNKERWHRLLTTDGPLSPHYRWALVALCWWMSLFLSHRPTMSSFPHKCSVVLPTCLVVHAFLRWCGLRRHLGYGCVCLLLLEDTLVWCTVTGDWILGGVIGPLKKSTLAVRPHTKVPGDREG